MKNQAKPSVKLDAEMALNDMRDAIATLLLVSLAVQSEGSVDRINQGISVCSTAMRGSLDKLAVSLGFEENFFHGAA